MDHHDPELDDDIALTKDDKMMSEGINFYIRSRSFLHFTQP